VNWFICWRISWQKEGQWHDLAYERLAEVGDWMEINSEAIYGTRAIEPYKESGLCYTFNASSSTLYAIYVGEENKIPGEVRTSFSNLQKGSKIYMLGHKKSLEWEITPEGLLIRVPESLRNDPPCKYGWTFKMVRSEE
jgi:alpha-L-fucosidase